PYFRSFFQSISYSNPYLDWFVANAVADDWSVQASFWGVPESTFDSYPRRLSLFRSVVFDSKNVSELWTSLDGVIEEIVENEYLRIRLTSSHWIDRGDT